MKKKLSEHEFLVACTERDRELYLACLAQGMKVNKRLPNGLPPVIVCCQNRFPEAIPLLCEKGVVLDQVCEGMTALLEAVRNNDHVTVQALLKHGASPDLGTKTHLRPLMLAARLGFPDCASALLDGKADVNLTDKYLWSPLHEAAEAGHADCIRVLLSHGANPLAGTKEHFGEDHPLSLKGFTPLHLAGRGGHTEAIRALLECTPVDIRANGKETPLMFAGKTGNGETVSLLIAAGADIEAVSRFGTTTLVAAVFRGALDIIRILLKSGANPNVCYEDMGPPISNAVAPITPPDNRDKIGIIELLLEFGADINLPCKETGKTVLHLAVSAKERKLVLFLLDHGARYGSLCYNRTAVELAQFLGETELAELILKYGPTTTSASTKDSAGQDLLTHG